MSKNSVHGRLKVLRGWIEQVKTKKGDNNKKKTKK